MHNKVNTRTVLANSNINFGTSGARGLVTDFTNDVCQAYMYAFVAVLQKKYQFSQLALGIDNRPDSESIAQRCAAALLALGIEPFYCGVLPTPALASYAMQSEIPCVMVTGSHIPFDRNGLKFYTPDGEIDKEDEANINLSEVFFTPSDIMPQLVKSDIASERYLQRYISFFGRDILQGKKIGIYEHSSAGRDLYPVLFTRLGAEIVSLERSDKFVPIDTEAVSEEDRLKAKKWSAEYNFDAIFSTDGDGDRPLVADETGEWLRGDILGLLSAQALKIDALAVPISCNTAIELSGAFVTVSRTRIGSPYVIEEFDNLKKVGTHIAGFEANGGFLLGSDIHLNGTTLHALPTRDAVLPALVLFVASRAGTISSLVQKLPCRYTCSDRITDFPGEISNTILSAAILNPQSFINELGFSGMSVTSIETTDGLRITLSNNDIIHLRPSGNAPELRCYSESHDVNTATANVRNALKNIVSVNLKNIRIPE